MSSGRGSGHSGSIAAGWRARLPRTLTAFFGRFHRLSEVQASGIPPILEGRDVLLGAPTASGKTEAYAAPLVERLLGGARGPFHTLVVSPTRALANDLKRRLEAPMEHAGVSFGRHTGEHKERAGGARPEFAVTTPEALDSLLARRPASLRGVRAVVLDEIHVLDGTPRGDQLRILLHRLDAAAAEPPQRIAASATVADPEGLAARYLRDATIVTVQGRRRILAKAFDGRGVPDLVRHLDALAAAGFRKVLVFCNRRADVETLAAGVRGRTRFGEAVFPHHGSLSRPARERTERHFLEAPAAVAFATLTLELGIDIGTVDYVLLAGVPPGVDSLLQRVGRGSRRAAEARAGYACATESERWLFRALLARAARGELLEDPYAFRPSVIVQQALVLAGSRGHVTAGDVEAVLPSPIRSSLPPGAAAEILDAMQRTELLEPPRAGRYVLSSKQDALYARGVVHGNIAAEDTAEIIDRLTGDIVGYVAKDKDPVGAGTLQIGGRGRREILATKTRILTDPSKDAGPPRFAPRGAPTMSSALGRSLAEELGAGPREILQLRLGDGAILLHGLGTAGSLLLAAAVQGSSPDSRVRFVSPLVLVLSDPLRALPRPGSKEIEALLAKEESRLAFLFAMGPNHSNLPPGLRRSALRSAAGLDTVASFLRSAALASDLSSEAPSIWRDL